jgi:two-component system cell cycle sensor histidine kinase/response regulator CckA
MVNAARSLADMDEEGTREGEAMPTVLLVEDDTAVRRVLRHMLLGRGHKVIEAGSAPEAIQAAGCDEPIDLVVTDVVMPQTDCETLIAQLQAARPALKVLLISGYSEEMLSQYGVDVRFRPDFLQKPFTAEQLSDKIRQILGVRNTRCGRAA